MASITANTGSNNWNTNGAWAGGVQPSSADDVIIPASAVVTIPTATTVSGRSLTVQASGTLAFASTTAVLNLGDSTPGAGNVALSISATATITLTGRGTINFISTSGTQQTITTNAKVMPNFTFNGTGGSWLLSDALVATSALLTLTAGTFSTGAKHVTIGNFSSTGAVTRAFDFTNSTIDGLAVVQPWTVSGSNLTLTATGSTINTGIVGGTFTGGTFAYNTVNFTGITGLVALGPNSSFVNLSATSAVKTGMFRFNADALSAGTTTVTGTLTLGGSTTQGVNRLLVFASLPGNVVLIDATAAAVVINGDVDFMDTTINGSPSWTNTGSAFIGDCLGNSSLITTNRTTPATQTHTASAGGNWSDVTKWTSRVPLPQDNVVVDVNTTGTLTNDMPRFGASLDFTGFAGTLAGAAVSAFFGSLTFSSTMTVSINSGAVVTASGRGSHTITMAGKTLGTSLNLTGPGGTYSLQDAFITTQSLIPNDGTFNTNNNSVTCLRFTAASGRSQTVNLGTSIINITDTTASTLVNTSAAVATYNMSQATFVLTNASTGTRTFALGSSHTIGAIVYTVTNSPGILSIGSIGTTSTPTTVTTLTIGSGRGFQILSGGQLNVTNWNVNGGNNGYIYLPGVSGNYISAPDSAPVSVAGDMDFRVRAALDDWTPAADSTLIGKWGAAGQRSYQLRIDNTGKVVLVWSADGTAALTATSTVATGVADGSVKWIRGTMDVDNGASQRVVKFYTSDDGSVWTQLGTTVTTAGATSIFDSNATVEVGTLTSGTVNLTAGKFYRAIILNGYDGAGTVQFDADFTSKAFGANSFTEGSTNAATVSINGASAQVGDGRVALTSSTPGSAATLSSSGNQTSDYLTIQDSTAQGANWYAGLHSVDNGNNKGWIFNTLTPPSTKGNFTIFGGPN